MKVQCKNILELMVLLKKEPFVFIQVHNFPDPDAVASAFGLQRFLDHYDIQSRLVYDMDIQRAALSKMITDLGIDIRPVDAYEIKPRHKIILVDGCKGNSNVTDLAGEEVGIIDHHPVESPEDVLFSDIRPDYGACATIVASYFMDNDIEIPREVATAFLIGINTDTQYLMRPLSQDDLNVYFHCYTRADMDYVVSIIRNNICMDDLYYFRYLIDHLEHFGRFGYCCFKNGCNQNLLGILANFMLTLEEIDVVILCAENNNQVIFSLRSEDPRKNAAEIIRSLLKDIGFGGGHADMAGGAIPKAANFDEKVLIEALRRIASDGKNRH